MNARQKQREDVGVELYGVQQELATHQMKLEGYHDTHATENQRRLHMDQQLADVRQLYKDKQLGVNSEKKKGRFGKREEGRVGIVWVGGEISVLVVFQSIVAR